MNSETCVATLCRADATPWKRAQKPVGKERARCYGSALRRLARAGPRPDPSRLGRSV